MRETLNVRGRKHLSLFKTATPIKSKTVMLLDVDGIINMQSPIPSSEIIAHTLFDDVRKTNRKILSSKNKHFILYSPSVVKKLNEWSESIDIKWLTTWHVSAQNI